MVSTSKKTSEYKILRSFVLLLCKQFFCNLVKPKLRMQYLNDMNKRSPKLDNFSAKLLEGL